MQSMGADPPHSGGGGFMNQVMDAGKDGLPSTDDDDDDDDDDDNDDDSDGDDDDTLSGESTSHL